MSEADKQKEQLPAQFRLDPSFQALKQDLLQYIQSTEANLEHKLHSLSQTLAKKEESL